MCFPMGVNRVQGTIASAASSRFPAKGGPAKGGVQVGGAEAGEKEVGEEAEDIVF